MQTAPEAGTTGPSQRSGARQGTSLLPAGTVRAVVLFGLWMALGSWSLPDMAAGLIAACLASWASLILMPPKGYRGSAVAIAQIILMFPFQSFAAGLDVALRAFDPHMPLRPGIVPCPTRLKGETECNILRALMSLQPGSLPVEQQSGSVLLVHCLDSTQPFAERYRKDEALFAKAAGSDVEP